LELKVGAETGSLGAETRSGKLELVWGATSHAFDKFRSSNCFGAKSELALTSSVFAIGIGKFIAGFCFMSGVERIPKRGAQSDAVIETRPGANSLIIIRARVSSTGASFAPGAERLELECLVKASSNF
jgi:hypothetical protein